MRMLRDAGLCCWFAAVAAAFWGPLLGVPVPSLTPVYGVFLVAAMVAMALRFLRPMRREEGAGSHRG